MVSQNKHIAVYSREGEDHLGLHHVFQVKCFYSCVTFLKISYLYRQASKVTWVGTFIFSDSPECELSNQ